MILFGFIGLLAALNVLNTVYFALKDKRSEMLISFGTVVCIMVSLVR